MEELPRTDASHPAEQATLPFGEQAEPPIPFALTARARRAVAPGSLPALSVVASPVDDDPSDTRPARARALLRAGASATDIARQLGVDDLLVRAWVGDVGSLRRPRRGGTPVAALGRVVPVGEPAGELRRRAALQARRRLTEDASFALGVGLAAGLADVDRHAVVIRTAQPELAARLLRWVLEHAEADPRDVRAVLRIGAAVAGDAARHRWASALPLTLEQLDVTRWHHAPREDAEEVLLRIHDPEVAARVAGWCDALRQPDLEPADVAF